MQLFKYLPSSFLAFLFLVSASAAAQQTEEVEETKETEIIIITETIDENGNKNVNKTIHKGNFTEEEIEKIVKEESVEGVHDKGEYEIKVIVDEDGHQETIELHEGHERHEIHTRGYMGVNIEDDDAQGVRITGVTEGSPAESAGMMTGDVIQTVNGKTISNTEELIKAVGSQGIGTEVEVTYDREGTPATVKMTLVERPESDLDKAMKEVDEFKWVEKEKTSPKPRLGVYIESVENGVEITSVSENSLAESAGLKSGDIITSFNGIAISSPEALIEAVQQSPIGEAVVVKFERDGEKMSKTVTF